jgi:hypothetical protein
MVDEVVDQVNLTAWSQPPRRVHPNTQINVLGENEKSDASRKLSGERLVSGCEFAALRHRSGS